jgi:hypothetical protein
MLENFAVRLFCCAVAVAATLASAASFAGHAGAAEQPMHKCDPVTDEGWSVVPERQTLATTDGAPYRVGADWFVDRTTTVLPLCNYFNSIGVFSLRSYSLDPVESEQRIAICRGGKGVSVAVAPYAGPCPPRQQP